ncbi:unnamed protein product [Pylaiella littoralis]
MARSTRSSPRSQSSDSSPQPPPARSRKRVVNDDPGEQEESTRPRRQRSSGASQGGSVGGGSGGGGGGGSGSGSGSGSGIDGAGAGSGSGPGTGSGSGSRRRSSGVQNISSQGGGDDGEEMSLPLTESQGVARNNMIKAAKESSREVQIEAKDEKNANELSSSERKDLVKKMMRYLLIKGFNQEPVTKKEMMDTVLGQKYRGKRVLKYVLTKADQQLKDAVGFRVKTVSSNAECHVKDTYYVINVLNNTQHSKEILRGRGRAGRGLLMLILSVIHCHSDKAVCEDHLFKKLHDHVDQRVPEKPWQDNASKTKIRAHIDGLGDIHDHLAALVKQHYLVKKTLQRPTADGSHETIPVYSMGARSILEIGSRQLLELMAQVLDTTVDPSDMVELQGDSQEAQGLSQMATQDS